MPKGKPSVIPEGSLSSNKGRKKKASKPQQIVVFDPNSDPLKPLPLGLHCWCRHSSDERFHKCEVLDRKRIDGAAEPKEGTKKGKKRRQDVDEVVVLPPAGGGAIVGPVAVDLFDHAAHPYHYYVHYPEWDRRMDEWVPRDRIKIAPSPDEIAAPPERKEAKELDSADVAVGAPAHGAGGAGKDGSGKAKKAKRGKSKEPDEDDIGNTIGGHGNFTDEDIKAHEEATKVKNIDKIVLGKHEMTTWYYSPFPEEYNKFNTLYICEFCLSFFGYQHELDRHMTKCVLRHPPGNEIYRSDEQNVRIAVFEVDGNKEIVYCQNLCYIAKLFLDHKTLEYDTSIFIFYVLCEVDDRGCHTVGYFSKEKYSTHNFNLACILTLPCHQRKGYGKFIISLSYELSKVEDKVGSPEKPISDLGLVSYMSYWSRVLVNILKQKQAAGEEVSIDELSRMTSITKEDIIETLKHLRVLQWHKTRWVFSAGRLEECYREQLEKRENSDPTAVFVRWCQPEKLHWTPPTDRRPERK